MKVLDPQNALLTNVEVHQFLIGRQERPREKPNGAYMPTDQRDYQYIRKELMRYHNEITPHVTRMQPAQVWMSDLISKLKQYGLTKSEVLNLINMGIGKRASTNDRTETEQDGEDAPMKMEDDDQMQQETQEDMIEAAIARDELFFRCAVEESDERFPEDGQIREIIKVFQETIPVVETNNHEVNGHDHEEAS